ncbi:uncharacterized protein FA14DRAFT_183275 [Meira miltonrushii]|uniref:Uncharacterized protein n=1 Tax=Meira miltonrushii TaxID=1280837 RepID=A0A316VKR8_9BASI|nr:uncharacterized protein FA14DRAFT_183275 [Meira miltonrushii]PWN36943.1 hypothetical protein FA14DRAFT_183275 [Meira miltonrushii]
MLTFSRKAFRMKQTLLTLFFLLFTYVYATDYNAVQTSINLILEIAKDLQHVPDPSKVNQQEAGDVTYYLETLTIPIKNSKAQIQNFSGVLESKEADSIITSIGVMEADFAKGMPDLTKLKTALIAAGAKEDMEYYMFYLNDAIHGFAKALPKIFPSPQQAKAADICSKLQAETLNACTSYYNNCTYKCFNEHNLNHLQHRLHIGMLKESSDATIRHIRMSVTVSLIAGAIYLCTAYFRDHKGTSRILELIEDTQKLQKTGEVDSCMQSDIRKKTTSFDGMHTISGALCDLISFADIERLAYYASIAEINFNAGININLKFDLANINSNIDLAYGYDFQTLGRTIVKSGRTINSIVLCDSEDT